jgi:hypothetical protein
MEAEGLLPQSQVPANRPYPEPARSNPHPHIPLPEISILIQSTHQQMHYLLNLERFKIYIKIHTKYRFYMFRSSTIIRELVLSLTEVMLEHLVKLCPYRLRGGVAACLQ